MAKNKFDFSGWATRNDLRCSDGRTIRKDAFADQDGATVPLVWQHQHNDPGNVLGHALLENREEGVYAYCSFNNTDNAAHARELVRHGDVEQLSIWANGLKQSKSGDVLHGSIKEVSIVLAGANPGALIDFPVLAHGEESEEEVVIYTGFDIDTREVEIRHSDTEEDQNEEMSHADEDTDDGDETIEDVFNSLSDKQKKVVYYMIGKALDSKDTAAHSDIDEGEDEMKKNVFESAMDTQQGPVISHDDMKAILADAKRLGSLRDAVEAHIENGVLSHAVIDSNGNEVTYGIADIDWLFPEAKNLNTPPDWIKREMDWVQKVMSGVHHTPFSRIKSMFADITMDEARAKGYTKGKRKIEEVFSLLKRSTTPTTVYKKQKLDRDDIIDITDFDVVSWLKAEMRMMLNEELARAYLIGDGRSPASDDKINELNIRPIYTDDDLYSIKVPIQVAHGAEGDVKAKAIIDGVIRARKNYKGSGNPTFFTTEDWLTEMLLLEDGIGHKLYKSEAEVATAMRVKEIVTVEVMEGATRTDSNNVTRPLVGIVVNLTDYNVGADKGGAVSMFEDFDIDYNQEKYLIETRCSGALVKPYSAMVIEMEEASN